MPKKLIELYEKMNNSHNIDKVLNLSVMSSQFGFQQILHVEQGQQVEQVGRSVGR